MEDFKWFEVLHMYCTDDVTWTFLALGPFLGAVDITRTVATCVLGHRRGSLGHSGLMVRGPRVYPDTSD